MSAIETPDFGTVREHLVDDLPVFGLAAIALDAESHDEPTEAQKAELEAHAAMLRGRVATQHTYPRKFALGILHWEVRIPDVPKQ